MPGGLNGVTPLRPASNEDEIDMTENATTTRFFDKLDQQQASLSTIMADVARIQGAQVGLQAAIQTVSNAVGDVNEVKMEARETKARVESLEKSLEAKLTEMKQHIKLAEQKSWVEGLVKYAVGALGGGGLATAFLHWPR